MTHSEIRAHGRAHAFHSAKMAHHQTLAHHPAMSERERHYHEGKAYEHAGKAAEHANALNIVGVHHTSQLEAGSSAGRHPQTNSKHPSA